MASERLKELQKLQDEVELGEIKPDSDGKEVNLGAGSYRARDSNEASEEERKRLIRKKLAEQEKKKPGFEAWRIYTVIGITLISCLLLLWALFSGATPNKYVSAPSTYKPLTLSQLKQEHESGSRASYCPEGEWIPDECLDGGRRSSKTMMDKCQMIFDELEYTEDYLIECGLLSAGD